MKKKYEETQEDHLFAVELWSRPGRYWFVAAWYSTGTDEGCGLAIARTMRTARKIRAGLRASGFRKSRIRVFTRDQA